LICFLREAPYLTPYLPTIPTFLVRLPILEGEGEESSRGSCSGPY
jgi:hypothetical protein